MIVKPSSFDVSNVFSVLYWKIKWNLGRTHLLCCMLYVFHKLLHYCKKLLSKAVPLNTVIFTLLLKGRKTAGVKKKKKKAITHLWHFWVDCSATHALFKQAQIYWHSMWSWIWWCKIHMQDLRLLHKPDICHLHMNIHIRSWWNRYMMYWSYTAVVPRCGNVKAIRWGLGSTNADNPCH